jgi:hypothetical protein
MEASLNRHFGERRNPENHCEMQRLILDEYSISPKEGRMKSAGILAITLVIIIGLSLQVTAAPPSYPLKVRGGGNLQLWTESTQTQSLVKLIVKFAFGTRQAGAGLRPGQGSWLDRGMRSGEPTRLEYYVHQSDAQKIIDYLRSPASYYTFECYNTGKGYLQVTKAYSKSVRID